MIKDYKSLVGAAAPGAINVAPTLLQQRDLEFLCDQELLPSFPKH